MSVCGHLGYYLTATSRTHVRFGFSTHAAAGANVAPNSAFEAADIRIYKATDGAALSATQRSSAAGITMTSPFDSLTGVHTVDISLADNTDAGFYATGCYYEVWLSPDETVDSQAITGICLCSFDIGVPTANSTQLAGSGTAATMLSAMFANVQLGTVDDATFSPTDTTFAIDDIVDESTRYQDQAIFWVTGANAGITCKVITYAYASGAVRLTVNQLPTVVSDGETFIKMGRIV